MIDDIIKGAKLGAKPFFYVNTVIGVLPVYYTFKVHWLLSLHVLGVYMCFFMMGILLIKLAEDKGVL